MMSYFMLHELTEENNAKPLADSQFSGHVLNQRLSEYEAVLLSTTRRHFPNLSCI
jgi:hypothetical protein